MSAPPEKGEGSVKAGGLMKDPFYAQIMHPAETPVHDRDERAAGLIFSNILSKADRCIDTTKRTGERKNFNSGAVEQAGPVATGEFPLGFSGKAAGVFR
jgi:hypothetical protein